MSTPTAFLWQVEVGGGGEGGTNLIVYSRHRLMTRPSMTFRTFFSLSPICLCFFRPVLSVSFISFLSPFYFLFPFWSRIAPVCCAHQPFSGSFNAQPDYLYIIAPGAINDKWRKIRENIPVWKKSANQ
jgi:hypothetical protein